MCRKCYNKTTGKSSRAEVQMSDYLDNINKLKPYLVGSDQSFRSMGGCQKYRPDKLYIGKDLVLIVECDEHQHKYNNGTYECDEKRISDCYDEFPGKKLVVIRWNPDHYNFSNKKDRNERLMILENTINDILMNSPKEMIYIYYLFYDKDNPRLSQNIKHKLIYE